MFRVGAWLQEIHTHSISELIRVKYDAFNEPYTYSLSSAPNDVKTRKTISQNTLIRLDIVNSSFNFYFIFFPNKTLLQGSLIKKLGNRFTSKKRPY